MEKQTIPKTAITNSIMQLYNQYNILQDLGFEFSSDHSKGSDTPFMFTWTNKKYDFTVWTKGNTFDALFKGRQNISDILLHKPINEYTLTKLKEIMITKDKLCSDCGVVITDTNKGGSHFAGEYCASCWDKYKQKNSGTCSMCKRKHWECVC